MADDEQFSLCWNNFNTNLSAGFHESLIQGDLVDVTLAAEGQLVKAHRLILSVCSPYFRKMFTQMPANQHAFIFLKDVSHSALKDLIQFMYCGEVNVKQDALPAFISTAEALQIKGLTETGESAPAQQSPAKDTSHHLPSSGVTTIPSSASSPRAKPLQRSRIQSYKIDSDNESEHEKVVQIQATSTPATASSSSSGPSATIVTSQISTAPQQVQIIQQQQQAQKRSLQQRASITPQTTQVLKRAKLSDPLEASEPAQIQTVQIVKQITQTPQQTISSEAEYVEMPIETINPKAEPDYADDPSEVEAIETEHEHEHEHEQALTEHEAAEHDQDADDNYVEDETYGDMAKYDESYFTEGEEVKAGASGFGSESYTESGTAADQAAQANTLRTLAKLKNGLVALERRNPGVDSHSKQIIREKIEKLRQLRSSCDTTTEAVSDLHIEFIDESAILEMAVPHNAPVLVTGFNFPILDEYTVELLEQSVNENERIREEYIHYLRVKKPKSVGIINIFHTLFLDEAMYSYNFSGICNRGKGRKAMQNYTIFVECMLEAWRDHGINIHTLRDSLNQVIKNINGRKRNRKYFAKRKQNEKIGELERVM